jgi:hypothetical protein
MPITIIPVFHHSDIDEVIKSQNSIRFVIPAEAGIQSFQDVLDPGFRRGDASRYFLRDHQYSAIPFFPFYIVLTISKWRFLPIVFEKDLPDFVDKEERMLQGLTGWTQKWEEAPYAEMKQSINQ